MDIVIKVDGGTQGVYNWQVPHTVTFHQTMDLISTTIFPQGPTVTAFEYLDEDGDRITVRSEEEMAELITMHVRDVSQGGSKQLMIFPKVGKTQGKRNIHGLKVLAKTPHSALPSAVEPMDSGGGSRKQQAQDLAVILASGASIADSDINILHVLGAGSAGTVYKALSISTGKEMAVKRITLTMTPDFPEIQKQIMSELQVLHQCRSPVIIAFYGAYFVESRISICTEYMDGGSLDKYKKITEPVLGRMTVAIVTGLHYLWSFKIMHRDVKPMNLLVNTRGQVKLCDFSISVQLAETMAKTVIGTRAYMAPERILGHNYSVTSDVWSLGVSLFELATGMFPYNKDTQRTRQSINAIELINSIVYEEPPSLLKGIFSDVFRDFIHHCMKKDPALRPSPKDLLRQPLISQYDDGNLEIIAIWVCDKLKQMESNTNAQSTASSENVAF